MTNDGIDSISKAEPFGSHLQLTNTHLTCISTVFHSKRAGMTINTSTTKVMVSFKQKQTMSTDINGKKLEQVQSFVTTFMNIMWTAGND